RPGASAATPISSPAAVAERPRTTSSQAAAAGATARTTSSGHEVKAGRPLSGPSCTTPISAPPAKAAADTPAAARTGTDSREPVAVPAVSADGPAVLAVLERDVAGIACERSKPSAQSPAPRGAGARSDQRTGGAMAARFARGYLRTGS